MQQAEELTAANYTTNLLQTVRTCSETSASSSSSTHHEGVCLYVSAAMLGQVIHHNHQQLLI
jgi:hypothetical protein